MGYLYLKHKKRKKDGLPDWREDLQYTGHNTAKDSWRQYRLINNVLFELQPQIINNHLFKLNDNIKTKAV